MVSDTLPPIHALSASQQKSVKLNKEQLDKSLERLYSRCVNASKEKQVEFEKAVEYQIEHNKLKRVATGEASEAEKKAIEHLYTIPLEKKKKNDASTSKKHQEHSPSVKHVTPEEQEGIVERLYSQALQQHSQELAASSKRVYGDSNPKTKKLDKDGVAAAVETLYTKAIEKKKTADAELEGKYAWKRIVSETKVGPDQAKALAERLQTKSH